MKKGWLLCLILLAGSHSCRAIYGPSLTRADVEVSQRACQEAHFAKSQEITNAVHGRNSAQVLAVLGDALREWRATPEASALYPARAFCIHEVVPTHLPPNLDALAKLTPTAEVLRFREFGVAYFYYGPDDEWVLREDPVDLDRLAREHLDSPWGRQAFLMMTRLGWSKGECQEGPDQFREVIEHGEKFLHDYPQSEVSDSIRLELAHAYATWWNVSRTELSDSHGNYKTGADAAKQRAIELYREYLKLQKTPADDVQNRLKALQENPKGSNEYTYFCDEYED